MTLKRMDNVLIVVDDLEAVKAFFIELGLKLEGETTVEGPLVGKLVSPMYEPPSQCCELQTGKEWNSTSSIPPTQSGLVP